MISRTLAIFYAFLLLASCHRVETPKPRAYFRIDLPAKDYQEMDKSFPFRIEYPGFAEFHPDTRETAGNYWADIVYPDFGARIHLSYKPISSRQELMAYVDDAYTFVHRHIPKATSIQDEPILHTQNQVYGALFQIRGRAAASPMQFFATDSLNHFLRGALYFNVRPNNDSLAPVIDFIEEDIRHLFHSLRWE